MVFDVEVGEGLGDEVDGDVVADEYAENEELRGLQDFFEQARAARSGDGLVVEVDAVEGVAAGFGTGEEPGEDDAGDENSESGDHE